VALDGNGALGSGRRSILRGDEVGERVLCSHASAR
jgi:hypothetical protein